MTDFSTYLRDTPRETKAAFYRDIKPETTDAELSSLNDALNRAFKERGSSETSEAAEMKTYRDFLDYQKTIQKANDVPWPERTWRDDFLLKVGLIKLDTNNETLINWGRGLENALGETFRQQGLSQKWLLDHFQGYRSMLQMQREFENLSETKTRSEVEFDPNAEVKPEVSTAPKSARRSSRPGRPGRPAPELAAALKTEEKASETEKEAAPKVTKELEVPVRDSRPRRPGRPGVHAEAESRTREPEVKNVPPSGKDRPQMPEFLRIADEQRRGGNRLKTKVENQTETALPKKERIAANTTFEVGTPVLGTPPPEIVAEAAMMMTPPTHLIDARARARRPGRPRRPGKPILPPGEASRTLEVNIPKPIYTPPQQKQPPAAIRSSRPTRPGFGKPRIKEAVAKRDVVTEVVTVDILKATKQEPVERHERSVEKIPKPEVPIAATPDPERGAPNEICGDRKFPRKEANSLAEDVIRYSKVRDLIQTVNDMSLSQDDRNKIEGDVKLATGKSTFNAWMTIEFDGARKVSSLTLDHWEYGLDRPVKFDQIHQIDGEFKKADPKKAPSGDIAMTIKPGEPIRPPKPKQAYVPQKSGLKPPTPGIRRTEDKSKRTVGRVKL